MLQIEPAARFFFAFLTRGATAWILGNANRYGSMGLGKQKA